MSGAVKHSVVVRRPSNPGTRVAAAAWSRSPLPKSHPLVSALSLPPPCSRSVPPLPLTTPLSLTQPLIFNHNLNGCLGCGCGGSQSKALASGYKAGNKFEEIKLNAEGGGELTRAYTRGGEISTCRCRYSLIRISSVSSRADATAAGH